MQKTSLAIFLTVSGLVCTGAMGALQWQSWPKPYTRVVAAVKEVAPDETALVIEEAQIEPRNYKIASSFRRSRQIWGVYDKTSDSLESQQAGGRPQVIKTKLGELILKDGQVVLVSPLSSDSGTHIEMARLPYAKKGNSYSIDLERASDEQKAALTRLYEPLLSSVEKYEKAEVVAMNCQRTKALLACELSVMVH